MKELAGIVAKAENETRLLSGLTSRDIPDQRRGARGSFGNDKVDGANHGGGVALEVEELMF